MARIRLTRHAATSDDSSRGQSLAAEGSVKVLTTGGSLTQNDLICIDAPRIAY
jgi:hypothetical protein